MKNREIKCRYCKSNEVIRYGNRNNKACKIQIYKCKSCKKIFSDNTTFPKMKHKGEIITVALDLYFKNMSLRGVKDHLRQIYGVKVSHVTILFWIRKYSKIFKEFTDKLKGESSGVLHADEMMVNVKGKIKGLKLLTTNIYDSDKFEDYKKKLSKELGIPIEIKKNQKIHDRFLILGDKCWSIGSSIKDLGNKDATVREISEVASSMKELFTERWNES